MFISDNKVVTMAYKLTVNGKLEDQATAEQGFDFIQGTHMIIPGLEAAMYGKTEGEKFCVSIAPEDAYGEYDMSRVINLPKDAFVLNGELREDLLEPGKFIPMLNSAGEVCNGMVVSVQDDSVTMDFNGPMAGKTLEFEVEVLSVREATAKELTEGLHGEFLPHNQCHCHGKCHGEGSCHGEGGCHGDGEHECHCNHNQG